ncbi:MAG: ArnT family glycosyltransferase [Bacteriovoracaceae bacterium]
MKKLSWFTQVFPYVALSLYAIFYLYDVGNLSAIRQGTEALYLNISQEMYDRGSFLTPYFNGAITWTKPPMHFWLAFPFHFLFFGPSVYTGRLSVLALTLGFCLFLGFWFKKEKKIPTLLTFFFFATSFGFFRYSRIYMMEMTLMVFSTISVLAYFSFYKEKKWWWLLIATLSAGAATLVKGPVSLVMSWAAVGIFHLYEKWALRKNLPWKEILLYGFIGVFFSSLWFVACYFKYGYEFIDYFFIRENLGKFSSQSYSPIVLFQGLLTNSLPWTQFIIPALIIIKKRKQDLDIFLLVSFAVFFFLWFIPKQRSHHYAIPSLTFFLSLIWITLSDFFQQKVQNKLSSVLSFALIIVPFVLFLFSATSLYLDPETSWLKNIIALFLAGFTTWNLLKKKNFEVVALALFLNLSFLWTVLLPQYFFPLVPNDRVEKLNKMDLRLTVERAYFFKEALGKSKPSIDFYIIPQWLENKDTYLLITSGDYEVFGIGKWGKIIDRWPKWKRRPSREEVKQAIQTRNIKVLQEEYFLVTGKNFLGI